LSENQASGADPQNMALWSPPRIRGLAAGLGMPTVQRNVGMMRCRKKAITQSTKMLIDLEDAHVFASAIFT